MPERDVPRKYLLGAIAFGVCFVIGAIFLMSESTVLKAIGTLIGIVCLVAYLASDWIEAWLNERHVESHPHLLKNEAIGKVVVACGDFESESRPARGFVTLNGEKWRAYCSGNHVPKAGDSLVVSKREGLTLVVQPQDSAAQNLDGADSE